MLETIPEEDEEEEQPNKIVVDNGIVLSNLSSEVLKLRIKSILIELEFKGLKRICEFSNNTF